MQIIINYLKKIFNSQIVLVSLILLLLLDSFLGIYLFRTKEADEVIMEPLVVENIAQEAEKEIASSIKVDLKGAVANPGVYEIASGALLNDLINQAGGFRTDASSANISLVYKLSDGLVINIPRISSNAPKTSNTTTTKKTTSKITSKDNGEEEEEKKEENSSTSSNESQNSESNKPKEKEDVKIEANTAEEVKIININTASREELITLNGIGASKAQAIIDYRNTTGLFATIEEIKNVKGIGEAIFAKIKDYITV